MKRSLIFLLIAALLFPCLMTSCDMLSGLLNQDTTVTTPAETTPAETTPAETTTEAPEETTTEAPEETTTEPNDPDVPQPPVEIPNLTSDNVLKRATIFSGESESELYAAEELAKYLTQKTVLVEDGGFPITLSIDPAMVDDSFVITATLSGDDAGMTIVGGNERGVLYGVYKFLEELGGVRYFMPGLETVPTTDIVLNDGVVLEYTPYFESRRMNWNCVGGDSVWCVKQGVNTNNADMSGKYGGAVTYGAGLFVHTLGALTETGGGASKNPCLSLDSPEGQANYQKVLKNLRAALEKDPTMNIASVSQNDLNEYCKCEYCMASYALYSHSSDIENGGTAGNLLVFVNAIAEELEDEYPNLIIDTLAYNYTQTPPKGIVPRENVCIRVCSIRVCFMHPFTECPDAKGPNNIAWTRTAKFRTDFINWGKICDRIFVWDYTTNFRYYIAPFSNFGALRENMRFYHENGVRGMFPQGNSQSISGEFGELRAYLLAKLMWNPYMSEEEYNRHMNEFLAAYYGPGWIYIRSYIDSTTALAKDGCINIYEEPLQSITKDEYLKNEFSYTTWWNKAEAIAGDRLEYVQRSRLQWRCIQILIHPDDEAALAFTADVEAYGIRWAEGEGNNIPVYQMAPFKDLYPNLQPQPEEEPEVAPAE